VSTPPELVPLDNNDGLAIGVDIGGTSVKLAVVDTANAKVIHETSFLTPTDGALHMAQLIGDASRELLSKFRTLNSIGVGVPGAMNADRSLVRYPPNLIGWKSEPLAEYLRVALPHFARIEVDNDAKVATLAEARFGRGKGEPNFILVTLGTGVGSGIFAENKIFRGSSGGAGELGHISIDYNGPPCACGSRGCIEVYIGQRYFTQRVIDRLGGSNEVSKLRELDPASLDPKQIADVAQAGDTFAIKMFEEAGTLLGFAFASVAKLLDMHTFIVTGGVAQAGEFLLAPARASLKANVFANLKELVVIREGMLGVQAGVIGAALLADS
jgi:glucokinase